MRLLQPRHVVCIQVRAGRARGSLPDTTKPEHGALPLEAPERPFLQPYRGGENRRGDPALRPLHSVASTHRFVQGTRRWSQGPD